MTFKARLKHSLALSPFYNSLVPLTILPRIYSRSILASPTTQTTLSAYLRIPSPPPTPPTPLATSPSRRVSTSTSTSSPMAPKRASSSKGKAPAKRAKKEESEEPQEEEEHDEISNELPELMSSTPLAALYNALEEAHKIKPTKSGKDSVVVYWMRNKDLRLSDNRALAHASGIAQQHSIPLVVLYICSPSDWEAHDRSPRRIDFMLRQLEYLSGKLSKMDIPLYTVTWDDRTEIVKKLLKLLEEWGASHVFGNIEHEVDELRRDAEVVEKVIAARKKVKGWGGEVSFLNDMCIVPPGKITTQQDKPYSVFSPWYRNWVATISADLLTYVGDAGSLEANDKSARQHAVLKSLFPHKIPKEIEGWTLDKEDKKRMEHLWKVGEGVCDQIMERFLHTKIRNQAFFEPPLHPGAEKVDDPRKQSKIGEYATGRNRVDLDGTSHISAYLAAGLISPRDCIRKTMEITNNKLDASKDGSGIGVWVSEVAWRDFYQHVLAAFPRVSMGRAFNLKFEDIIWQEDEEALQKWKDGKTGFPIVDAGMRALKEQGYMHNRLRMIVAMFLTKDLLLDWRLGEKHFMENLIDGDLGSNNGGWQWSSSTGTDPQPYFRVFNPIAQSEKSDPDGTYIKHFVPELKSLKGKAIHDPSSALGEKEILKMGYVMPIVDHAKARKRAIARYKNPGMDDDE